MSNDWPNSFSAFQRSRSTPSSLPSAIYSQFEIMIMKKVSVTTNLFASIRRYSYPIKWLSNYSGRKKSANKCFSVLLICYLLSKIKFKSLQRVLICISRFYIRHVCIARTVDTTRVISFVVGPQSFPICRGMYTFVFTARWNKFSGAFRSTERAFSCTSSIWWGAFRRRVFPCSSRKIHS